MIKASSVETKQCTYRLRVLEDGSQSCDKTFSSFPELNEALRLLECCSAEYLYWGPGWEGGSVRLSQAAVNVWRRIAQPVRRPPKRASSISSSSRTQVVA